MVGLLVRARRMDVGGDSPWFYNQAYIHYDQALARSGLCVRGFAEYDPGVDSALETLMLGLAETQTGGDAILVLGAQAHPEWSRWKNMRAWQWSKPLADAWDRTGLPRENHPPSGRWPVVALLPGKSKEEILYGFALARDRVAEGGTIIAALPNTAGAARFEKEFARAAGGIQSVSKHKCRAFWAVKNGPWNESLFDEWRALGEPTIVSGTTMVTVPGVFSAGRIDEGSRFLVDHLPRNLRGTVADAGAGWGFLADHVLRACPQVERVDLFEADSRALDCARINLGSFGGRVGFHWRDVTQGIPGGYDAVVMNPPFHSGQNHDVSLGLAFLAAAAQALRPGGHLFAVANRQLPYENALDTLGFRWRMAGENPTFKLLFGEKRG